MTALLFATSTHAGLLARTRSGDPVRWTQPEIVLVPVTPASRTGISTAVLRSELERAAEVWNRTIERRRAPRLRVGTEKEAALVRQDGSSVVVLQSARWCSPEAREQADCYDKRRSAITHLYPVDAPGSARDGEIAEADIEINAVDFQWTEKRTDGVPPLRAVLAHELGHVLGLDHPCVSTCHRSRAVRGARCFDRAPRLRRGCRSCTPIRSSAIGRLCWRQVTTRRRRLARCTQPGEVARVAWRTTRTPRRVCFPSGRWAR